MKKLIGPFKPVLISSISLVFMLGCSAKIDTNINKTSQANSESINHIQWENSEFHPTKVFSKLQLQLSAATNEQERAKIRETTCNDLNELDVLSLTLFESLLLDKENLNLIGSCNMKLLKIIDDYYVESRKKLSASSNIFQHTPSGNKFRFPDNTQKRDTSSGYQAWTGDVGEKEVVLTFDDGPSGIYTNSILKSLEEVNAKAIFFHLGKNVRLNPKTVKLVAAGGHSIGSHTDTHACLNADATCNKLNGKDITRSQAFAEVKSGHQAIQDVLGWVDPFFRFPFGVTSSEILQSLKDSGIANFSWNIDSEDWKAQSNIDLLKNLLTRIEAANKGIIVMHDTERKTAEILPALLRELYNHGYSIVLLQPADLSTRLHSKIVNIKPAP